MNVNGGAEIPLTNNTTGHVDGPEYAPDGKYIYYNANVTSFPPGIDPAPSLL